MEQMSTTNSWDWDDQKFPSKSKSLFLQLRRNSLSPHSANQFRRNIVSNLSLIQKFELNCKLKKHSGCVNTINWNEDGSLLVSGSDDTNICIWDYGSKKLRGYVETGHRANIFCTKFMPATESQVVISCSMDRKIKCFNVQQCTANVPRAYKPNEPVGQMLHSYSCHSGRVKKLATEVGNPHLFLSASEDSTIRQFDLREKHVCEPEVCRNIVVECHEDRGMFGGFYSLSLNPLNPNYLIAAGSSPFVRLYDRRMLDERNSKGEVKPVKLFCPQPVRSNPAKLLKGITSVVWNCYGSQLLASYSEEEVYLFDVNLSKNASDETHREEDCPDTSFVKSYSGHSNQRTIKEVNFFGHRSEFVVSGSDDGNIFLWDKNNGNIVSVMSGDAHVVNCIQGHPFDCALASSGIENNVKIWVPTADSAVDLQNLDKIVAKNKKRMRDEDDDAPRVVPFTFIQRVLRLVQSEEDDSDVPPECDVQ